MLIVLLCVFIFLNKKAKNTLWVNVILVDFYVCIASKTVLGYLDPFQS